MTGPTTSTFPTPSTPARTPEAYIASARAQYADDNVEIDTNATVADAESAGAWVAAWVWVDADDLTTGSDA